MCMYVLIMYVLIMYDDVVFDMHIIQSVDLILEAFEDELALLILILPYPLFGIVVFFLAVEHVAAEIEDCPPVHIRSLSLYIIQPVTFLVHALVELYKFWDLLDNVHILHLLLESFPAEVGERDEEMHQHWHLEWLAYEFEEMVHHQHHHLWLLLKVRLAGLGVDQVGQHRSREVQAEHVDLSIEGLLHQAQYPRDHVVLDVHSDHCILHWALLQDGQAEALRDVAILLLLQNLNDLLNNDVVAIVGDVLDASERWDYHWNQRGHRVPQRLVLEVEDLAQEVEVLGLCDLEDVPADELLD